VGDTLGLRQSMMAYRTKSGSQIISSQRLDPCCRVLLHGWEGMLVALLDTTIYVLNPGLLDSMDIVRMGIRCVDSSSLL
jgi:hypothetical protein